jgi:hypothetical protein
MVYEKDIDRWVFDGLIRFEQSSNDDVSVPRQDPRFSLGWIRSLSRDTLSVNAYYDRSSTLRTEFEDTGRITDDGTIGASSISGTWNHLLSERIVIDLGANYYNARYYGVNLVDYQTYSSDVALNYQYSELTEPYIRASASRYTPDPYDGQELESTDLYLLYAGVNYVLTEELGLSVEFGSGETKGPNPGSGFVGNASLNYTGERNRFMFTAGRFPEPISREISDQSLGGIRVNDRANARWGYDINERIVSLIDLSWLRNKEDSQQRVTRNFTATITKQLDELWFIEGYYRYRNQELSDLNMDRATAHIIGISLRWSEPGFSMTMPSSL